MYFFKTSHYAHFSDTSSTSDHWNYFGIDEALGPVAVSLRREKLEEDKDHGQQYNYRLIFRTSEVSHSVLSFLHPNLNLHTRSHKSFILWKESAPSIFCCSQLLFLQSGIVILVRRDTTSRLSQCLEGLEVISLNLVQTSTMTQG